MEIYWDKIFSENWKKSSILIYKINILYKLFQLMIISIIILYIIGFASLFVNRFYMIIILLRIEFIYMSLLLIICIYFSFFNILTIFVFLVRIVCEAGLGIRLLVLIRYFFGNEIVKSIRLVKC